MASGASKSAFVVAASIGAVEALKDQLGVCRWNFVFRSVQQHAKSNIRSFSLAKNNNKTSSQYSSSVAAVSKLRDETNLIRQSEDSLRKVMYLNCWGS